MMNAKNINRIWWIIFIPICFLLGYFLYDTQRYGLFFREQQQLFLFDSDYILETLMNIGGVSTFASRFIVQFFYNPTIAVIATTTILALIVILNKRIVRNINGDWITYPLSFVPSLCLCVSLLDSNLYYDNVISILIVTFALNIYIQIKESKTHMLRLIAGTALTILVFITAASASILFAICALLIDCLKHKKDGLYSLIYIIISLTLGLIYLYFGGVGSFIYTCTPMFFYELTVPFDSIHYASWISLPLCLLISFGLAFTKDQLRILISLAIMILVIFQFKGYYNKYVNKNEQLRCQYEYYAINGCWDELKKLTYENMNSYTDANYMNLALANKGELADVLFKYPQHGPYSLINIPKDKTQDVKLARILFAIGDYSAAQNVAFNALHTANGYNPSMLEMIASIEIERGETALALKYIDKLSKSIHYAKRADELRKTVSKERTIEVDGAKDIFVLYSSPMEDIYNILDNDPKNKMAFDYGISYLLLAKDFNNVYDFVERYYDKSDLSNLPICAQEALLFFSDYYATMDDSYATKLGLTTEQLNKNRLIDLRYCESHGVSKDTINRFLRFKSDYGKARNGNLASALSGYKGTFWHYLLFENI